MITAICPTSASHKRFTTSVHAVEDWEVDENGSFVQLLGTPESGDVSADRLWNCAICGSEATVVES